MRLKFCHLPGLVIARIAPNRHYELTEHVSRAGSALADEKIPLDLAKTSFAATGRPIVVANLVFARGALAKTSFAAAVGSIEELAVGTIRRGARRRVEASARMRRRSCPGVRCYCRIWGTARRMGSLLRKGSLL